MIEQYYPTVPKIELNRRGPPRPGWSAWGNEAEEEAESWVIVTASSCDRSSMRVTTGGLSSGICGLRLGTSKHWWMFLVLPAGSAKTSAMRVIRMLVDPHEVMERPCADPSLEQPIQGSHSFTGVLPSPDDGRKRTASALVFASSGRTARDPAQPIPQARA
jgi:hypothetical protein